MRIIRLILNLELYAKLLLLGTAKILYKRLILVQQESLVWQINWSVLYSLARDTAKSSHQCFANEACVRIFYDIT